MKTVRCNKNYLIQRCLERGYLLEKVMPCVVARDGDNWTIDVTHWAYPHPRPPGKSVGGGGAGTELKVLLEKIGIKAKPNCSCNTKARVMDERGIEWCEQNKQVIVAWLEQEAKKRRLPFLRAGGMLLVARAIAIAKKKRAKEGRQDGKQLGSRVAR